MKKSKITCIFLIFIAVIFIITYSVFGEDGGNDELTNSIESGGLNSLHEQKNELQNKINETNEELTDVQNSIDVVNEQLDRLNAQIAQYQEELNSSNVKLAQTQMSVDAIKTELEKAEKEYNRQKSLLEQRLVAMYEGGETVYLDVLLASTSIQDFLSRFYYLSKIAAYDQDLMRKVTIAKQDIEGKKILLEREVAKLTEEKQKNEMLLNTYENTKVLRKNFLNGLTEHEKGLQERIEIYEKDLDELESEILRVSLENISEEYIGGELAWPVPGYSTITSGYGMRMHPVLYIYKLHTGVDIGAPTGVPVIAVNDGIVTLATYSTSYGNYIMVDHGGGVATLYAHGSKVLVEEGQEVKKGNPIMLVGSTGWSTGPHLHFEVRIDGQTYDPLPYITSNKMLSTNEEDGNENTVNENEVVQDEIENNIIN